MDIQAVAERLVALNREEDKHMEIYEELYSPEVVSIENWGERMESQGFEAIKAKGEMWFASIEEIHEMRVSEPLVADKSFAVTFFMDVTHKEGNELGIPAGRSAMTELAIYRVNDEGKIISEEFIA